eukprot:Nk52_evm21s277 gene=Nk52_evmTU21s277
MTRPTSSAQPSVTATQIMLQKKQQNILRQQQEELSKLQHIELDYKLGAFNEGGNGMYTQAGVAMPQGGECNSGEDVGMTSIGNGGYNDNSSTTYQTCGEASRCANDDAGDPAFIPHQPNSLPSTDSSSFSSGVPCVNSNISSSESTSSASPPLLESNSAPPKILNKKRNSMHHSYQHHQNSGSSSYGSNTGNCMKSSSKKANQQPYNVLTIDIKDLSVLECRHCHKSLIAPPGHRQQNILHTKHKSLKYSKMKSIMRGLWASTRAIFAALLLLVLILVYSNYISFGRCMFEQNSSECLSQSNPGLYVKKALWKHNVIIPSPQYLQLAALNGMTRRGSSFESGVGMGKEESGGEGETRARKRGNKLKRSQRRLRNGDALSLGAPTSSKLVVEKPARMSLEEATIVALPENFRTGPPDSHHLKFDGDTAEPHISNFISEIISEKCERHGLFLDIGAGRGVHGVLAGSLGCQVIFFEMQRRLVVDIVASSLLNGLQDRVAIVSAGISENPQVLRYRGNEENVDYVYPNNVNDHATGAMVEVDGYRFDEIMTPTRVVLAKLDTTGTENTVLTSGDRFFNIKRSVEQLIVTIYPSQTRVFATLKTYGFIPICEIGEGFSANSVVKDECLRKLELQSEGTYLESGPSEEMYDVEDGSSKRQGLKNPIHMWFIHESNLERITDELVKKWKNPAFIKN